MRVVIYGSRSDGHAKVCLRAVKRVGWECAGCLDDVPGNAQNRVDDLPVIGVREDLEGLQDDGVEGVVLGFGDGAGRRALLEPIRTAGLSLPALVDPAAIRAESAILEDGVVVLASAVLGDDVHVEEAALVNTGALLTHDVLVEAGASVGPGVVLSGRTRIGQDAQIGAGAVLLPDVVVGAGAIVGAGAVVTTDVEPRVTAIGVPARPARPPG